MLTAKSEVLTMEWVWIFTTYQDTSSTHQCWATEPADPRSRYHRYTNTPQKGSKDTPLHVPNTMEQCNPMRRKQMRKCIQVHSCKLGASSLSEVSPNLEVQFISLQVHEPRTVSSVPGTVHRAPHRCGPPLPPKVAPRVAGSVHTGPAHEKNQSPHPPYHGSPEQEKWL